MLVTTEQFTLVSHAVGSKLQISGISTARFFIDERVKLFGVTKSNDSTTVPNPIISSAS